MKKVFCLWVLARNHRVNISILSRLLVRWALANQLNKCHKKFWV